MVLRERVGSPELAGVNVDDVQTWQDAHGTWSRRTIHDNTVRLWDNLEEHYTEPLARDVANGAYLHMVCLYCSACKATETRDGAVERHIERTLQSVEDHEGAELQSFVREGHAGNICSGCGGEFLLRKKQGEKHLASYTREVGDAHQNAVEKRIMRYSLGPSAAAPAGVEPSEAAPRELQESRMPRQASGKRRRGKRGGRRH